MITLKNIARHELIGMHAEVVESSNKSNVGLSGKIIDETKNTFVLRSEKKDRTIQKKDSKFMITFDRKKIIINGKMLIARPEERIKKKVRKW